MEEISQLINILPSRVVVGAILPVMLGGYYVSATDASSSSKLVLADLLVLSLIALLAIPAIWLWVLLLQICVGIYTVFYLAWIRE